MTIVALLLGLFWGFILGFYICFSGWVIGKKPLLGPFRRKP